jgi:gamma-glutamylputrescine oxidase
MTRVYWRTAEADGPPVTGHLDHGPPPDRVDVAIVGAGFAGLSIACDLLHAAPGIRLAVLDAHWAGYGASGRNAGGVLPFVPLWLLPGGAGRFDHAAVHRLLYARIARRPGGFAEPAGPQVRAEPAVPTRMALLGRSRLLMAGLDWLGESLATAGFPVRRWSRSETAEYGVRAQGAVVVDMWTIQPARTVAALVQELVRSGGRLYEHTPVVTVIPGPDRVELVLGADVPKVAGVAPPAGDRARMVADRVVVATGGYTATIDLPDPPRAEVKHTYMRANPVGPPEPPPHFFIAPGHGNPYWRFHNGNLLFGGVDRRGLQPGEAADALPAAHTTVDRLLRRWAPAAADLRPSYRWGGPLHVTPTETPHLGVSAVSERIIYALGYSGSGVALTLASGPLVRDLVLGTDVADAEAVELRRAFQETRLPLGSLPRVLTSIAGRLLRVPKPPRQ